MLSVLYLQLCLPACSLAKFRFRFRFRFKLELELELEVGVGVGVGYVRYGHMGRGILAST
jgi:hypothetical protein